MAILVECKLWVETVKSLVFEIWKANFHVSNVTYSIISKSVANKAGEPEEVICTNIRGGTRKRVIFIYSSIGPLYFKILYWVTTLYFVLI